MIDKSVRPADDIESILQTYGDMLFRLCLLMLGNGSDAEDVIQETMIKYMQKSSQYQFKDEEHKKAWLIKVATNGSKDVLRYRNRHPIVDIDEIKSYMQEKTDSEIIDALMTLPEKFRIVLILFYVEGYSTKEIATMIGKTSSAVKMRLQKGRDLLKVAYKKECM